MKYDKSILMEKAFEHNKFMEQCYADAIKYSADNTKTYSADVIGVLRNNPMHENEVKVIGADSQYIIEYSTPDYGKICVLNFADYKKPGGLFMEGSGAQEEQLCHCSGLYNVLTRHQEYYDYNNTDLNGGAYRHRALYSPQVPFILNEQEFKIDVLTCAAPNKARCVRYGQGDPDYFDDMMFERIKFIFEVAITEEVDTFILGAWGCGVFRNNPTYVAKCFKEIIKVADGYFKKIIFPIPGVDSKNFTEFKRILN